MSSRVISKREAALWVTIWLGAVVFAVVLGLVMSSAQAADAKFVVMKRDVWSMIRTYQAPDNVGFGTHTESYTITISTNYYHWPDAAAVNKLAVASGEVCYHRNTGNGSLFQGVNANPIYLDDNNTVNPGAIEVGDDNTGDNCQSFKIADAARRWFRMDQDPAWRATGKVRIAFTNDQDFDFKWGGINTKFFHPGDDPEISNWLYIQGDWPGADH